VKLVARCARLSDQTASAEQILKEALELAPVDRAEMIERLFLSFDSSGDRRVDVAWSEEIESRIDAYDQGKIAASWGTGM
jgi:putative addiction module component (TIGR02574 family)